jgi:hypothetical protein
MAGEVGDLFAGTHVVEGDDTGIACCCEESGRWGEGDGSNCFNKPYA